jgi:hypothetical protein
MCTLLVEAQVNDFTQACFEMEPTWEDPPFSLMQANQRDARHDERRRKRSLTLRKQHARPQQETGEADVRSPPAASSSARANDLSFADGDSSVRVWSPTSTLSVDMLTFSSRRQMSSMLSESSVFASFNDEQVAVQQQNAFRKQQRERRAAQNPSDEEPDVLSTTSDASPLCELNLDKCGTAPRQSPSSAAIDRVTS